MKPIAGRVRDVAVYLRGKQDTPDKKEAELILSAQRLLLIFEADLNVVVVFRYPGTKRAHVEVAPCHIVAAAP